MWFCAVDMFSARTLSTKVPELAPEALEKFACIYNAFEALFSWRPCDVEFLKDPPPEIFERISFQDFVDQYLRFRNTFIPQVLASPVGGACWKATSFSVRFSDGQTGTVPANMISAPADVDHEGYTDVSCNFGSHGCIGQRVRVSGRVAGRVLKKESATVYVVTRDIDFLQLYKAMIVSSYDIVREANVWHVLRLFHRLVHAGATTEALSESVCSYLTQYGRRRIGPRPNTVDVINAVLLKSAGIRGSAGEDAFFGAFAQHLFSELAVAFSRWSSTAGSQDNSRE